MSDSLMILFVLFALIVGALIGWLFAGRQTGAIKAERDGYSERFREAIVNLEATVRERDDAKLRLTALEADQTARGQAFDAQMESLREAKEALSHQFSEIGGKILGEAQRAFLDRAEQRFKQSEEVAGQGLKALLQPVSDRLTRYEEAVGKVEAERQASYGELKGLMDIMRQGQEQVKAEAARLGNSLRNAPKARGRWGEQQLRNVLETCGLSEHADFQTEVSIEGADGRLRPDVIIRVPGGRNLVIDAKVSLNAYQDAFEAESEPARIAALTAHAQSMKTHVNALGTKAYQDQFDDTPDYVIMFVPGEHFLAAALDQDHNLWDFAFNKRVLLATPTNLIAIARTVSAVWKQEKMAGQAREIAELGRELYGRLATMGGHVARVGKNLDTAVGAYNAMVGSLESQVMTQAKKFEELNIDTGGKSIDALPIVEQVTRPLVKLVAQDMPLEPVPKTATNPSTS
jgi:DNA recombination protein RmuC